MSEPQPEEGDEALRAAYKATRKSLIERLHNWEDQKSWDEFYQTYWRLIYSVALKAGLRSEEAFDAVQETILCIAKQQKEGKYDPAQGSFKAWLMNMTRWRITDQFRKRKKDTAMSASHPGEDPSRRTSTLDRVEDPAGPELEKVWDAEWAKNLTDRALEFLADHRQEQAIVHRRSAHRGRSRAGSADGRRRRSTLNITTRNGACRCMTTGGFSSFWCSKERRRG